MKEKTICINPHKLLLMTMVEDTITKKVAGNICSSLSNARAIGAGICSFSTSAPRGYRRAFFTNSFEDMGILKVKEKLYMLYFSTKVCLCALMFC
jgi:hypothetical protein